MIDDPDVAAWTPVGHGLVCNVRLGVAAPAAAPGAAGAASAARTPRAAARRAGRSDLDAFSDADARRRPSARQHHRRGVAVEPQDDADVSADRAAAQLLHVRQRRSRPQHAGRRRRGAGDRLGAAVIGLFGDGSSMYSIQALWSAADLKLPMTIVIVNNGGYAALSEFSSHFNIKQPIGTELPGIDFVGLARSLGCAGVRVEQPASSGTLRDALQSPVPILVDVAVGERDEAQWRSRARTPGFMSATSPGDQHVNRRMLVSCFLGTTIEWYDFLVYGFLAPLALNRLFFPSLSPLAGTIAGFGVFAVGSRPGRSAACSSRTSATASGASRSW